MEECCIFLVVCGYNISSSYKNLIVNRIKDKNNRGYKL